MIKRIIQRIIVGVGVALILSFIYSKVNASTITDMLDLTQKSWGGSSSVTSTTFTLYSNNDQNNAFSWSTDRNNLQDFTGYTHFIFTYTMSFNEVTQYVYDNSLGRGIQIGNSLINYEFYYLYHGTYYNCDTHDTYVICRAPKNYVNGNIRLFFGISHYNYGYCLNNQCTTDRIKGYVQISPNYYFGNLNSEKLQQQIIESNNNNTQVQQNIYDSINDDTPVLDQDVSSNANDWSSKNANNGVINQLVQMPITLLNGVVSGLSGTCTPYNLGNLFGTDLILPCVNMSNILGSVWTLIDVIISGVFIFLFGGRCVKMFNDFTNLRSGQIDQLYGGGN